MAALILAQITLGLMAANWRVSPTKIELFFWHKSTGMLISRSWGCASCGGSPIPRRITGEHGGWERAAARLSHRLLYALMIALPVTGWIINSASNVPFRIFWLIPCLRLWRLTNLPPTSSGSCTAGFSRCSRWCSSRTSAPRCGTTSSSAIAC